MRGVRAWLVRLAATLTPWRRDREIADELNSHLELAIEDNVRAGMSSREARRRAIIRLGGLASTGERCRRRNSFAAVETFVRDLKYACRTLRRNPGFTVVCVLIVALGVGANTAVFSVVNAVLLKPLPYRDPDRIVTLAYRPGPLHSLPTHVSIPDFLDWREQSTTFDSLAYYRTDRVSVQAESMAEYASLTRTTPDFLRVFAMHPLAGRALSPAESAGGLSVVLISSNYARSHFGEPARAIGRPLRLFGISVTVVGVLPSDSSFPEDTDIWAPAPRNDGARTRRQQENYFAVGLLREGVSLAQARVQMTSIAGRLAKTYPDTNSDRTVVVTPLLDRTVGDARATLNMFFAAVALLLLIACANVGTLLLARATGRAQEIAARVAIGATRGRIVRQLLVEGLLQAMLAGTAGFIVAILGTKALIAAAPATIPRLSQIGVVDGSVLAFTLAISVVVSVLFALPPALHATGASVSDPLRQASARTIGSHHHRLRDALVIVEMAFTVVLLVAAGLLVRSLVALQSVPLGFQPDHVIVMEATAPGAALGVEGANAFFSGLLSDVSTIPGVVVAGATMALPGNVGSTGFYWIDYLPSDFTQEGSSTRHAPAAIMSVVAPGTFGALGMPLRRGRDFRNSDARDQPFVAVINEALAREGFGNTDPLGHAIFCGFDSSKPMTIIGIVGDVREYGPAQPATANCFMPYSQHVYNGNSLSVVARTSGDPAAVIDAMQRKARERSPEASVKLTTLETLVAAHTATPRFRAILVMLFGIVALGLALAGVYGVMAHAAGERSKEIGLRIALGARAADVLSTMLRKGLQVAGAGLAVGVIGALVATRLLGGMLFNVTPTDSLTYLGIVGLLGLMSAVAVYIPAYRSTKLDPLVALRQE